MRGYHQPSGKNSLKPQWDTTLLTPIRMAKIKKTITSAGDDGEKLDPHTLLWRKTVWRFLKWFNIELPYGQAIPLLDMYPREMKTNINIKTYTQMFTIAKKQKLPKWPSTDKWVLLGTKEEWSTNTCCHTGETWKHHSKWKTSQKTMYFISPLVWNVQHRPISGDRKQISGCQGQGGLGGRGRWPLMGTQFLSEVMKMS